jgi:outer membrane protein assembly factor BamD (BamD/ComL family)
LHPDDKRVPDAQQKIDVLRTEQARGSYETARYYERHGKWEGAKIYYNAVVDTLRDKPNALYAESSLRRIDAINKRLTKSQKP